MISTQLRLRNLYLCLSFSFLALHISSCEKEMNRFNECLPEEAVVYEFFFSTQAGDTLFFNAASSDPETIEVAEAELNKPIGQRLKHINGILKSGACEHNSGYDWHFSPDEWQLVETSIEWCDVFPGNPEETGVDRACPWSSRIHKKIL